MRTRVAKKRAKSRATSGCRRRKQPCSVTGPTLRGSTGLKIQSSAIQFVTQPTTPDPTSGTQRRSGSAVTFRPAPPSRRGRTSEHPDCRSPSASPTTKPELTSSRSSRLPTSWKRSTRPLTFGPVSSPTHSAVRSRPSAACLLTSRATPTANARASASSATRVASGAPPTNHLPSARPGRPAAAPATAPTRAGGRKSATFAGSRFRSVPGTLTRSVVTSTRSRAMRGALAGTMPCQPSSGPNGGRSPSAEHGRRLRNGKGEGTPRHCRG